MRLRIYSSIDSGVQKATILVDTFTNNEKTQAAKFGKLTINLGGAFASVSPAANFSVEPVNFVIDPVNTTETRYERIFRVTADIPDPAIGAKVFLETNQTKITDAVTDWKALSDLYPVDNTTTI